MAHSLIWLPEVLRRAGLKVSEVKGWENRGRTDVGRIFGVICHHTVGQKTENMPSLDNLTFGDAKLAGPKAQLGLARDGTFFVIAAGRANHAGKGQFSFTENGSTKTIKNGNSNFIGIEGENTGLTTDFPWPEVQMEAYARGVAAILKHLKQASSFCIGHREWTKRKIDPLFDMHQFRANVAAIMDGTAPAPALIPPAELPAQLGGPLGRPTLRRGMIGELTKQVQIKVGVPADGNFGPKTEAAVRAFQRANGLVPDGIVGPKTWEAVDKAAIPVGP